jgi:hypothetical protein
VRYRGDHDRVQVVDGGDGTRRDTRFEHAGPQGGVAEQVAEQFSRDPAVGDRRDRSGQGAQAGQEGQQPGRCLAG